MKMTADAREEEKIKTETYIKALNEEVTSAYNEISTKIKKENFISDENVIFTSSFAPMLIATLTSEEIKSLSDNDNICQLDLFVDFEMESSSINMGDTKAKMGVSDIASQLSLTGNGVKIGIHDDGNVSTTQDTSATNHNLDVSKVTIIGNYSAQGDHPTYVAAIAAGRDGIAPNAEIYSASGRYNNEFWAYNSTGALSNFEALINSGVRVINCSWGIRDDYRYVSNTTNYYSSFEKYIDNIIATSKVTVVWSSGNEDDEPIRCPALAFNCITVNGFMNNIINDYSYIHRSGCFKPDVIACSLDNGTSVAAPVVSGMIALMYEYKPNLMTHPELVKAILLASVHEKIQTAYVNGSTTSINENLTNGLTDRQGAGVPNLYRMISIVAQHSYGYGIFNSTNGYTRDIPILQPKYGASKINVSMAYLQTDVTASNPTTCDDYDISLLNSSFTTKNSSKSTSSTEMIYCNMSNTDNRYTLKIKRYESSSSPMIHMSEVRYGYAWSTDKTKFYPTNYEDGIYYIRNAKSGKYLTYNSNNNYVKLEDYNGNNTQLWIIKDGFGIVDSLKSANGTDKNMDLGSLSGSFYYAVKSSNNFYLNLYNNSDGTYSFERFINTSGYRLGVYNNSLNAGVYASWYTKNVNNQSQKWYLESTGYKRGDVNLDGEINNTDASIVQSWYASSSNNLNNIQKFLADYNGDGTIDAIDSSLILASIS